LKNMRDTSLADPIFGQSDQHEMYQGMLDQQLSLEMASGKGIGLAEMLVRQLGGETGLSAGNRSSYDFAPVGDSSNDASKPAWNDPQEFVRDVWPHARRAAEKLNVVPEALLAQAALETGWGRHVMNDGNGRTSFNLFGIKAGQNWDGNTVSKRTIEFRDGIAVRTTAEFRRYDDVAATFDDYVDLIRNSDRYKGVPGHDKDVAGFANALQKSGYATDPKYADKINSVHGSDTMQRALAGLKSVQVPPITHQPASVEIF